MNCFPIFSIQHFDLLKTAKKYLQVVDASRVVFHNRVPIRRSVQTKHTHPKTLMIRNKIK